MRTGPDNTSEHAPETPQPQATGRPDAAEPSAAASMPEHVQLASTRRTDARRSMVRTHLERYGSELYAMLARPATAGLSLARRHAELMDDLLRKLCVAAGYGEPCPPLLLGAVGGYGRGLLGWKSDIDVCCLTHATPESVEPMVEEILYPLWDVGVEVGHQVLAMSEVADSMRHDLPTATELLDFRPLSGDLCLLRDLEACLGASALADGQNAAFIGRLEERTTARQVRFGDSVYLREPDLKNGKGGLRDLDFALWAARARFRVRELRALPAVGVLTPGQVEEAARALDFVWTARNHLHELSGRRTDRLTFAAQEALARKLGYERRADVAGARAGDDVERTGAMVEAFMSDYYRQARVITLASEQILGSARRRAVR